MEKRHEDAWMAVSFACGGLVFVLVIPAVYLWTLNPWLGVQRCLAWVGNLVLLSYANKQW